MLFYYILQNNYLKIIAYFFQNTLPHKV